MKYKFLLGLMSAALLTATSFGLNGTVKADQINIRIASGHPPTVVYAGLMKNYFQSELKKAVESKTSHKVKFIEGYSGSIVKVFDTFEGVQNGVVDIGGFCYYRSARSEMDHNLGHKSFLQHVSAYYGLFEPT